MILRSKRARWIAVLAVALLAVAALGLVAAGCGEEEETTTTMAPETTTTMGSETTTTAMQLSGTIEIDGSSTVFPITEAVAEEFGKIYPDVRVNVGISGTGGGFKRFTVGETDISNASRPIKDEEAAAAVENKVEYIEMPIAVDGLSVMVNPENTWCESMTVEELKLLWEPESTIKRWNQIRPEWPDEPINLYGPGTDSGTFDYFTAEIVGEEGASRADFTASEDDNILVQGIAGDPNALGYFGFAYYVENTDKLKLVAIDGGSGPVLPSVETINDGTYAPLSRPLFIYVSVAALERPEVMEFVKFYMTEGPKLVEEVGYVLLPENAYTDNLAKLQ